MIQIKDLNIESEILPLLDFTLNSFAKEALRRLLLELPGSPGAIAERQEIIKGFLSNRNVFQHFSYTKGDLPEVYTFLNTFIRDKHTLPSARFNLLLYLQSHKTHRLQLQASVIQCIHLFHRLYHRYVSLVNTEVFPPAFKAKLHSIHDFLSLLNTAYYDQKITEYTLKVRDLAAILGLFRQEVTMDMLSSFWEHLFLLEAYLSLAKATERYHFHFPEFSKNNRLKLQDFYHPILKNPVRNSLDTLLGNTVLITGPNMSGKSTLLKSISLCIYLAHIGMSVPATACLTPYFESISIAINPNDDIIAGYSHFMMEVLGLKKVVTEAAAGRKCFAVFDELFKGTNIEDATAIATLTLKGLTKFPDSIFLISTHLHALKDTAEAGKTNTLYLDCDLQNKTPTFTYQLREGWSDLKIGQILFEQEGLNELLS